MSLSKWMKAYGVSAHATDFFDSFRKSLLWSLLGTDAAPTTKARAGELVVDEALRNAVKARLDDLLTSETSASTTNNAGRTHLQPGPIQPERRLLHRPQHHQPRR